MKIVLEAIGHRYNSEWIFKNVSCAINSGEAWVVSGANGSGKSTLLRIVSGYLLPTQGKMMFLENEQTIPSEQVFRKLAICAPYLELIEEFTLQELVNFHFQFKKFVSNLSPNQVMDLTRLEKNKALKYFSSGMKQRVKLALAILSDVPLVLLDEPTMNLDQAGIAWYQQLVELYRHSRTFVVSSNSQPHEYEFCHRQLLVEEFKRE